MIISKKHHFIFIKTRKTASTSVQVALVPICGAQDIIRGGVKDCPRSGWSNRYTYLVLHARGKIRKLLPRRVRRAYYSKHATISDVIGAIGENIERYFRFAFVRNPFDLVVSRFFWDRFKNRHSFDDFGLWVQEHYSQQRRWERDLLHRYTYVDGGCVMDFVGRFETLDQDYRQVCNLLSLDTPELPRTKSGIRDPRHYSEFYTAQSRLIVERLFAEDLRAFDYAYEEK
jgi:hypothetical protein